MKASKPYKFPKSLRRYETDTYYYDQESVLKALGFKVGGRTSYGTIRCDGINHVIVEVGRKVEPREEA